jgi:hypothetical protein
MQLRIGSRVYEVADLPAASARYERFRGMKPSSRMKHGTVLDDTGATVARVSYNAKVWPPEPWTPDMRPIFVLYAAVEATVA